MSHVSRVREAELRKRIQSFRHLDQAGLPRSALEFMWMTFLWDALKGKYPRLDEPRIRALIQYNGAQLAQPGDSGDADVLRQLAVLQHIETTWRFATLDRELLLTLYAQTYGMHRHEVQWRNAPITLEAGFTTPVPPVAIEREMQSYWQLLARAHTLYATADLKGQFALAVELFARLIWIHPFPDGNGRTARLIVNLLMRRWQLPYLPVPKVRNAPQWLAALQSAWHGKTDAASGHFQEWMLEMLQGLEGPLAGEELG